VGSAIGFFVSWARTRLWLPKFAHVLEAIGLLVGVLCVHTTSEDAPIHKHGPAAEFLIARALPAMVYFFFVFHGGQRAAISSKPKTAKDIANLIDRFLNGTISYLQEWTGFVECRHPDSMLDSYGESCGLRNLLVNSAGHKTPRPYQNSRIWLTTCGGFPG